MQPAVSAGSSSPTPRPTPQTCWELCSGERPSYVDIGKVDVARVHVQCSNCSPKMMLLTTFGSNAATWSTGDLVRNALVDRPPAVTVAHSSASSSEFMTWAGSSVNRLCQSANGV